MKGYEAQTRALYPIPPPNIRFYSYIAENSQKATLNPYFNSRFSVKPSKFPIHFAKDCRPQTFLSLLSTAALRNMPVSIHCAKCARIRILPEPFILIQGQNPGSLIYEKMQVRGNPYSGIFYAVYVYFNNIV